MRELASLRLQMGQAGFSASHAVHRMRRADLRPDWVRGSGWAAHRIPENSSLLASRDRVGPGRVVPRILIPPDPKQSRVQTRVRERLDALHQTLELQENYGLLGQQAQLDGFRQNQALGKAYLRSMLSAQIQGSLKKAEQASPEVRAVSQVHQKLDAIVKKGVAVKVNDSWGFGTRADLPNQAGRLWLTSPLLNGSVDFRMGAQEAALLEPGAPAPEAVEVKVARPLFWEVQSGVTYGGTSRTMTAHLSRPLATHLTCSVENRQNLSQGWTDSRAEQTARINYRLTF
jgi:hypothetical protein